MSYDSKLTITVARFNQDGQTPFNKPFDNEEIEVGDLWHLQKLGGFRCVNTAAAEPGTIFSSYPLVGPQVSDENATLVIHKFDGENPTPDQIIDIAEMLGARFAAGHNLEERRKAAADRAFDGHEFGDAKVEAINGWETDGGDYMSREVFFDVGATETVQRRYGISFKSGTAIYGEPEIDVPVVEKRAEMEPGF